MLLYRVEHTVVMILGFLVGAMLAMCVARGDVLLVVVAGIVLGYFAHAFLDQNLGGELFWPFAKAGGKNRREQSMLHRADEDFIFDPSAPSQFNRGMARVGQAPRV